MSGPGHWETVWAGRDPEAVSWFEADPALSRALVRAHARPGPAVDVGAGASAVPSMLLDEGFAPVTALDLSAAALAAGRARMGAAAGRVDWVEADATRWNPPRRHALWHDRAVFHFLTDDADRARYLAVLDRALAPGGVAILVTFADDGPEKCSGLQVRRWAPEALAAELARLLPGRFAALEARRHVHRTPGGAEQRFQASAFRKAGG